MSDTAFFQGTRSSPLGDPKAGISADLDALAAYVASLNSFAASPKRNSDGSLTAAGQAGKLVFAANNCAACHSGTEFSNSDNNTLHDIGTLKASSGTRLGGPLTGIDVPTLRGTWGTAPYLHDGSAATIADAITAHNGVALGATDLANLAAYVEQIDASETTAPVPGATDTSSPTKPATIATSKLNGLLNITWAASTDNVGVAGYYVYRSTNGTQGPIVATVTTTSWLDTTTFEGVRYTYAVAAFDAAGNVSPRSALKTALAPSVAPTKPTITTINVVSGSVNLAWTTSTDNVGVTGYRIARSTNGTLGPVVATVTGTTWLDTTVTPGVRYTYAVAAVDAAGNVSARSAFKSITP
jgi:chitodextrinase